MCIRDSLVSNEFFAVYKWKITGKVNFEKTADYSLLSVLAGQGHLTVDGKNYPIQKGRDVYKRQQVLLQRLCKLNSAAQSGLQLVQVVQVRLT